MKGAHLPSLSADFLQAAFISACEAELAALKPGNVHVHAAGHGMDVERFRKAAQSAAPFIAGPGLRIGARIENSVAASMAAAGCNTNLGIVLLCAPLAAAAQEPLGEAELQDRVAICLDRLDGQDARDTYGAIRSANPGGLGQVEVGDVVHDPTLPLLDAMRLAAARDRIAEAYVTGFRDLFTHHLTAFREAAAHMPAQAGIDNSPAVTTLYMRMLADFPDSHIERKYGASVAAKVQTFAREARPAWHPIARPQSHDQLLELDRRLKREGYNPGTTADFVVATLFTTAILGQFAAF